VLVFTLSAGAVVTPALLGGKDVQTLGMTVYELVTSTLNWPLAAAFASILVLCQFALIAMYFRGAGDASRRGE
jgi:putative spermidine/putrescine transport system permease protein